MSGHIRPLCIPNQIWETSPADAWATSTGALLFLARLGLASSVRSLSGKDVVELSCGVSAVSSEKTWGRYSGMWR